MPLSPQESLDTILTLIVGSTERATWLSEEDREVMRGWIAEETELQHNIAQVKIEGREKGRKEI